MKETFIVNCPQCNKEFSVASSWNGKEIECPKCKYRFTASTHDASSKWKEFLKNFYRNNKKTIFKITGIVFCVVLLIIGVCKVYAIWKEQAARWKEREEARRIAAEKEAEERRIAAEKEAQYRFIETLEKYIDVMKKKKKPIVVIRRVFNAYKKFFKKRKIKYIEKTPKDIIIVHYAVLPDRESWKKIFRGKLMLPLQKNSRFPSNNIEKTENLKQNNDSKW